jgi:hypothetical protein
MLSDRRLKAGDRGLSRTDTSRHVGLAKAGRSTRFEDFVKKFELLS